MAGGGRKKSGAKRRAHGQAQPAKRRAALAGPALLGAALLPPLALRTALLFEQQLRPALVDLRGLASDLGAALLLALVLDGAARWSRSVACVLGALWMLLCYGNFEHVLANRANLSIHHARYLADPTFLAGSAFAPTHPLHLALLLAGGGTLLWLGTARARPRLARPVLAWSALMTSALALLWPQRTELLGWRQSNVVLENLVTLASGAAPTRVEGNSRSAGDLSGEPVVKLDRRGMNVLLVMVEALSGGHIAPIAEANGRTPPFPLPRLAHWSTQGLAYTSFLSVQRQTNQGEYAILCGEYPKLLAGSPKMSEYADDGGPPCLAAALAEAGYRTVYLQAAPLAFMMKDQFMAQAGFQEVLGEPWFEYDYGRSKWGVDDRAYFEQALRKVRELQQDERPWFLALLTVGTHHPYNVPDEFSGTPGAGDFGRAAQYADEAVGSFLEEIRKTGVLDDTLVLVTSDESAGIEEGGGDLSSVLSENWGFLIASAPGETARLVDEPFTQVDLALSVLDYLGLRERVALFSGRSVFRQYSEPRTLAFGNIFKQLVGGLNASNQLYLCPETFQDCVRTTVEPRRIFAPIATPTADFDPSELEFLRDAVAKSMISPSVDRDREIELVHTPAHVPLVPLAPHDQIVFGGQHLDVPASSRLEMQLEADLVGTSGSTYVIHDLVDVDLMPVIRRGFRMQAGERLKIHYTYETGAPLPKIENRLWLRETQGQNLELVVRAARMLVTQDPDLAGLAEPNLTIHELGVSRPE